MSDTLREALVEVAGIEVRFGDGTVALHEVDLTIEPGEFVAVVGPSGSGKTTLLRVLAGLTAPTAGDLTRRTTDIGYVFQDATLLPWRTVRRNVELSGELARLPRAERRARADAVLEQVGLTGFAGHRPATLSGGMRMRTALARALMLRPELFLFDEPFGSLDEMTRHRLGEELQQLFAAERFAALFVTHSVAEAVFLADRVVVLSPRPGHIVGEVRIDLSVPRTTSARYDRVAVDAEAEVSALLRQNAEAGWR